MTPHQLETVLRVRRYRRDRIRTALGRILSEAHQVDEQSRRIDADRVEAEAALKAGTAAGMVDIDRAAALRYHVLSLASESAGLRRVASTISERLEKARRLLTKADQEVKAVERLRERLDAARRREAENRADREATDRYSALRAARSTSAAESFG